MFVSSTTGKLVKNTDFLVMNSSFEVLHVPVAYFMLPTKDVTVNVSIKVTIYHQKKPKAVACPGLPKIGATRRGLRGPVFFEVMLRSA
jgi:hypothetical protein